MSYEGYTRTFHDRDGRTRIVRKEAVNPQDIADWIKPKRKSMRGFCPKCNRNLEGALYHECP